VSNNNICSLRINSALADFIFSILQIRHATVEKLLERLTDLRFLSVDFLNSFLLTYKVFTDNETVINSLRMTVRKACLAREHEENSL